MLPEPTPIFLRLPLGAQLAQSYGAEGRAALEQLALVLDAALPSVLAVKRYGLFGTRPLKELKLPLGEYLFLLEVPQSAAAAVRAVRQRVVRGVAVKSEEMAMAEWLEALGSALEAHAATNDQARNALDKWLGTG